MCGLCGFAFADPAQQAQHNALAAAAELIRHRGPDSSGYFQAPGVGLAFRRLSIIDLETGDQPISSEDGSVTVACNGEIYNFVELLKKLEAKGHRFRTRSDVEVILHLYEDHGPECVRFLRGMFGFALWDRRRNRLMLARDRLGIKPMHYALTANAIYFGSEQKSILSLGEGLDRDIDVQSVRDLLSLGYVVGARTLCRGIRRLLPAHFLLYQAGSVFLHRYWEPSFSTESEGTATGLRSRSGWAEAVRDKLQEAVRMHMQSDVPVGAWLSPGIDSSAVVAMASGLAGDPIQSVTLAFDDPNLDETRLFPTLDRYPGFSIANEVVRCGSRDFELFGEALWHCEEPTHLMIPRLLLAKATARRVKVALTGEGADEILGGYSWYKQDKLLRPLSRLPLGIRRMMLPALRRLPGWNSQLTRLHLASGEMDLSRYLAMQGSMAGSLDRELLTEEFGCQAPDDPGPPFRVPPEFQQWRGFEQLQYFDLMIRLPDFVNHALDRASMACGLEVRVPFLDHELVEFFSRIPSSLKMRGLQEKHILREALRGVLPEVIRTRGKRGLTAPFHQWWGGTLPEFVTDALSGRKLREQGYFRPTFVRELLNRHRDGKGRYGFQLSAVLAVQMWRDIFRSVSPQATTTVNSVCEVN